MVFASDHGDFMGEKGLFEKCEVPYECLTHVPLVIRPPHESDGPPGNPDPRPRGPGGSFSHLPLPGRHPGARLRSGPGPAGLGWAGERSGRYEMPSIPR